MSLRSIEFDRKSFKSTDDCLAWISGSPYEYLLTQKGFQLRPRKACQFLSWEKRPVFHFSGKLWHDSKLEILRPRRDICIVVSVSESRLYYEGDIPELLPETQDKMEKKKRKLEETKQKQALEKENRKRKREEEKAKKSQGEKVDPAPATEKNEDVLPPIFG